MSPFETVQVQTWPERTPIRSFVAKVDIFIEIERITAYLQLR